MSEQLVSGSLRVFVCETCVSLPIPVAPLLCPISVCECECVYVCVCASVCVCVRARMVTRIRWYTEFRQSQFTQFCKGAKFNGLGILKQGVFNQLYEASNGHLQGGVMITQLSLKRKQNKKRKLVTLNCIQSITSWSI